MGVLPRRRLLGSVPVAARSFDPYRVAERECRAWVTYYRREWLALLVASVGLVRAAFRMGWVDTLHGAWLVLRANQQWAPVDNDPDSARATMERFYRLVSRSRAETLDTAEAARLEVAWWHAHRVSQHGGISDTGSTAGGAGAAGGGGRAGAAGGAAGGAGDADGGASHAALVAAVADLYAFVYRTGHDEVRLAAAERAEAMRLSDRWVAEGCALDSPLVAAELAALVRSYAALLAAVHRPPGTSGT